MKRRPSVGAQPARIRWDNATGADRQKSLENGRLGGRPLRSCGGCKACLKLCAESAAGEAGRSRRLLREAPSGTNLSGANLYQAFVTTAILRHADLSGADLAGADLTGALYDEYFGGVRTARSRNGSNPVAGTEHRSRRKTESVTTEEIFAATAVKLWNQVLGRVNDAVAALTEEQLQRRVAPNRNRVIYIVGHLIAVNDHLFPMLGLGERMYPELDDVYLKNPDGKLPDPLSASELKKAWSEVHGKLTSGIEAMTPMQWLERHSLVSEEDFAREPLRNRLAVLVSRTTHISFHAGQLVLAR